MVRHGMVGLRCHGGHEGGKADLLSHLNMIHHKFGARLATILDLDLRHAHRDGHMGGRHARGDSDGVGVEMAWRGESLSLSGEDDGPEEPGGSWAASSLGDGRSASHREFATSSVAGSNEALGRPQLPVRPAAGRPLER